MGVADDFKKWTNSAGLGVQPLHGLQIVDQIVRGSIECDLETDDRMPLMVIDGREVTWEEFGRILMTFEGWQFKLEIFDRSEEP